MISDSQLLAFKSFFADQLKMLDEIYNWPVKAKTKAALPDFPWHEWETQSGSAKECIALKKYLSKTWTISTEGDKKKLARWIVAEWGGVRSNRAATLEAHWQLINNDAGKMPLQGVASYSKMLTLKDCSQYAIYDARVAACLNAVQLQLKPEQSVFFPYIPSQSQHFRQWPKSKNFVNVFSRQRLVESLGWTELTNDETYYTYLKLLYTLREFFPGFEIYHFEMTLFSQALRLCPQMADEEFHKRNNLHQSAMYM